MRVLATLLFLILLPLPATAQEAETLPAPLQRIPDDFGAKVCAAHVLFWFPMFEQSVCGFTTLEEGYKAVCAGGDGVWDFTPGQMPKCVGYTRPAKPTPQT